MASRAAVILAAVQKQIESRRASLDGAEDLGQLCITIKLQAGTNWVRGVVWEEERCMRAQAGERKAG